ncbi:MAG: 30S ribosomal protein S5 [Rickettsiales bacterium]|jgi:small subunit ribosomal protein S5|nr:30S ribosomal protein S5 [Rickettsiales bacterium]
MANERTNKREKDDTWQDRLISVNRVTKVVKGGKNFSLAALVVVGDGQGRIGFGTGKAKEVPDAVKKATEQAKRNIIRVPLKEGRTIHHDIVADFGSGRVVLRPAAPGTGIIAGGPMRAIFEVVGIRDIVSKSQGSKNPHNMLRATFAAFERLSSPKIVAARRGLKIGEIVGRRDIVLGLDNQVGIKETEEAAND